MNLTLNFNTKSRKTWFNNVTIKRIVLSTFILTGIFTNLKAQEIKYTKPSLWFGAAAGANFNFYNGSTQTLNSNLVTPVVFEKGFGVGLYAAPLVEFYRPGSMWGVMLQTGYDGRSAKYDQVKSPCNCPRDLSTKLSYFTVEPSLRFAPFRSNFYLYGGPRLAFNLNKSFTYKQSINPDFPNQIKDEDVKGDFDNINKTIISMQIGAGYDISLSSDEKRTHYVLSPFVSFQPYFGQNPRSTETWNITTIRLGAALKIGRGHKVTSPENSSSDPQIKLTVSTPVNVPVVKSIRETFPVRNYIFFDLGSTEISDRYVLISKSKVKDFKEDQLEDFSPKRASGRSTRQMTVYYNVINILGDRMGKNPSTTVTLVGSSEKGPDDGKLMAESVKKYLVNVFGINASRISIEGRDKPKLSSEQPGSTENLELLREEDRRVSIESSSSSLLMEFQSGPEAPLKPIEIITIKASVDSNFSCSIGGVNCTSWSLEVKDDKGKVQYYGPYYQQNASIPNNTILGNRSEGDYKMTMIGKTKSGQILKKDTTIHLVKWVAPKVNEIMRFSILYEFNDSKAIKLYEKYLTDIVVPKIPVAGIVIINGYTDIIGDDAYNKNLSLSRANDVKTIMVAALAKAGRTDVKFETDGNGEDKDLTPFENKYSEERFYNRTVIIDILTSK
jgi:outer membrane protein OmpA-like peptidoglycan-associated protein